MMHGQKNIKLSESQFEGLLHIMFYSIYSYLTQTF